MADAAFEKAEEATAAGRPTGQATEVAGVSPQIEHDDTEPRDVELTRVNSGVSIEQAEADFQELQREFTGVSRASRRGSRKLSHADLEKARAVNSSSDEESIFDLEAALRGDVDAG